MDTKLIEKMEERIGSLRKATNTENNINRIAELLSGTHKDMIIIVGDITPDFFKECSTYPPEREYAALCYNTAPLLISELKAKDEKLVHISNSLRMANTVSRVKDEEIEGWKKDSLRLAEQLAAEQLKNKKETEELVKVHKLINPEEKNDSGTKR